MASYMAPFGAKGKGVKIRALCYGDCGELLRSLAIRVVTQVNPVTLAQVLERVVFSY